MPSQQDGASPFKDKSIYSLHSSTTNTLVPSAWDSSATLWPPSPSAASQSRPRSASPKPSFWQKLKADNEERKQKERQNVSAKEATKITGYGGEDKPYAYSEGAVMELLMNGYVDPKIKKSREEAKRLADTGKRYDSADTGKKES
ncbi:hypothetical protein PMIN06_007958 [Paraphaeosphaeria minitans]|uniref:Uncharacterized protein n=1 Tax=Paraphaeosphaeria minitans TaxID=565426 RepID=A0A9P6KPA9_9PLEO|nr:hypothetical protein PMIN01_07929 [Paraphaeosphaeria minitans]